MSAYSEAGLITGDERVVVSTVHKAKGLQFDGVVISSCVDDVYPNYFSKRDGPFLIEEDARLMYVAMTRAMKTLVFTYHDSSINRGRTYPRYRSPFLRFLAV